MANKQDLLNALSPAEVSVRARVRVRVRVDIRVVLALVYHLDIMLGLGVWGFELGVA
jgi:hypothetical protein